jgi:hypothetical protein
LLRCTSDNECPTGNTCRNVLGACTILGTKAEGEECRAQEECAQGLSCATFSDFSDPDKPKAKHLCRFPCLSDADCPKGYCSDHLGAATFCN